MSIREYSIFDFEYAISNMNTAYESGDPGEQSEDVKIENNFLPIACISVIAPEKPKRKKERPVAAPFTDRQLHKITMPARYSDIARIKLQALYGSIIIWDLTIHYKNGQKQMVHVPDIIYENSESPLIDLKAESPVESITVTLNAFSLIKKAPVVWIWGR